MCGCHNRCCKCIPATIMQWSGDYDFTSDLDIRNFAGYFSELTERQPPGTTTLFWRIRYSPDQAFIEYLTDSLTVVDGSTYDGSAFIDSFPHDIDSPILSGPVRDGIMYGLDMVPAGRMANNIYRWPTFSPGDPYTATADHSFIGSIDLKNYNQNGSPYPGNWTGQDHPDNPIDLPWVLEIGCSRCGCLDGITWPSHDNWHYSPRVLYGGGNGAIDPTNSTLISTHVEGCCQSITADDLESAYWPGDEAESSHAAICPPDCIVWNSDVRVITNPSFTGGGGARSIPGKSFPSDAPSHPAKTLADAGGTVAELHGWHGTLNGTDVARAARGDSADIDNVNCLYLVNPYYTADFMQGSMWSYPHSSADLQWVRDWLSLGNKTLLIDTPWRHLDSETETWADSSSGTAISYQTNIANRFLGWLGSSLSLYQIPDSNVSPVVYGLKFINGYTCQSTTTHELAPDAETLFVSGYTTGSGYQHLYMPGGGLITPLYPMGISGGDAIYEADCRMWTTTEAGPFIVTDETHPCVAVEEFANGNRIIATSLSFDNLVSHEGASGLAHIPGIGGMIARAIATA